ncbi:MAG TPA: hypothetical protein VGQ00_03150 [Candidatus Norongarragalinales archaeon]|jgi:hypothetical protein|nr:hypothetical protein [Candidatus Norongarragalinales archaeon]
MVDASTILTQFGFLLLFSVLVAIVLFPVIFLFSYVFELLRDRYPKTPQVLLMLAVTFLATFIVLLLIEVYLNFTLPAAIAAASG